MIANAFFGKKSNYYIGITSSEVKENIYNESKLKLHLSNKINNIGSLSNTNNFDFANSNSIFASNYESSSYAEYIGNSPFETKFDNDFSNEYNSWKNDSGESRIIVDYAEDGLVPLWELLPSNLISLKSKMYEAFKEYYTDNINKTVKKFNQTNNESIKLASKYVHADSKVIEKRSSDFRNDYDLVEFYDFYNLDKNKLIMNGFKKLNFTLSFKQREIYRGYQHVKIYDSVNGSIIASKKMENDSTKYKSYTFNFNVDLLTYQKNSLVIAYNATGTFDDDWRIKEIALELKITK